ncbi:MAG: alpha/beta fold hydrolase [Mycobacteriales bacterium]
MRRARFSAALVGGAALTSAAVALSGRLVANRLRAAPDPEAREPFGSLPGSGRRVAADDGVPLYVEEVGDPASGVTIVFVHGFALSMASWHYQRLALADLGRLVFYDQRGHGRSGRGPKEHTSLNQLGADLSRILEACVPSGPIVLVGHSLGGMTVMALAEQCPELFGSRIVGVAFLSSTAGQVLENAFGLPPVAGRLLRQAVPLALPRLARRSALLERGRGISSDLSFLATRYFSFGGPVAPSVVRFVESMLAATPVEVMLEFLPSFLDHDRRSALAALAEAEVLILTGGRDTLLPAAASEEIASLIPQAELVSLAGAGHMIILERSALVNLHLRAFIHRALRRHRPQVPA